MTITESRQQAAECAALMCLGQYYGIPAEQVAVDRLNELVHLAGLIRTHTDHIDFESASQDEINEGMIRALDAHLSEF